MIEEIKGSEMQIFLLLFASSSLKSVVARGAGQTINLGEICLYL